MKHVLVPIDFSPVTDTVLDWAAGAAGAFGSEITLLNVAPREPDIFGTALRRRVVTEPVPQELVKRHAGLKAAATRLRGRGIRVRTLLVRGERINTILDEARHANADIIVMGSHGRGALYRRLVGSVSEGVLKKAPCPVLVVPSQVAAEQRKKRPHAA